MEKFADYKKILRVDIPLLISDILKFDSVQNEIFYLIQDKQLKLGVDGNAKRIQTIRADQENEGQVYSQFTIMKRAEKGLQFGNVDLKVTGEFYDSMDIEVKKDTTEILAEFDKKNGNIMGNFDPEYDFLKLTDANLEILCSFILSPNLEEKLKKSLGL